MVSFDYAFFHVERSWKLAFGDDSALNGMDITADGFWRSFAAIAFSLPAMFFVWVMDGREMLAAGSAHSMGYLIGVNVVIEGLSWLLPILLLALILKPLGYVDRFTHLVIARNWLTVALSYIGTLMVLPSILFANYSPPFLLSLAYIVFAIFLIARQTRAALQCTTAMAAGLVIAEFFVILIVVMLIYGAADIYAGLG